MLNTDSDSCGSGQPDGGSAAASESSHVVSGVHIYNAWSKFYGTYKHMKIDVYLLLVSLTAAFSGSEAFLTVNRCTFRWILSLTFSCIDRIMLKRL